MSNTNNEAVSTTHKPEFRKILVFHSSSCSDHLGHRARKQKPPGDHILDQLHTFSLPIFSFPLFLVAHTEGMDPVDYVLCHNSHTKAGVPHSLLQPSVHVYFYYSQSTRATKRITITLFPSSTYLTSFTALPLSLPPSSLSLPPLPPFATHVRLAPSLVGSVSELRLWPVLPPERLQEKW